MTQSYAFEAVLDERVVRKARGEPQVLLWDAESRKVLRPARVSRTAVESWARADATAKLRRNVWAGSSVAFACARPVREHFAAEVGDRARATSEPLALHEALAAAVRRCEREAIGKIPGGAAPSSTRAVTRAGSPVRVTGCAPGPGRGGGPNAADGSFYQTVDHFAFPVG